MSFFTSNISVSNPIPQEVRIYYSKDFAVINILFLLVFMALGVFFLTTEQSTLGPIICLFTLYFSIAKLKWLFNNKPQVIINVSGIQTSATPFYKWSDITKERVSGEYAGRGARPMLEYTHPDGDECVKVEPLNIRPQDLNILLKYYRKPWAFSDKSSG